MEIRDSDQRRQLLASDQELPEIEIEQLRGPSRTRVILHLTGIGLGFLLLLVGLGLGISRNMWDKLALIQVIAGGALVAGWITVNHRFLVDMIRNRRVMVGTNAVFMGILAIVLLVMVNFISDRHFKKWDVTEAKLFTLSPQTESVLKNLDKDVTVISFHLARTRTGQEDTYVRLQDIMRLYTQTSPRIKVEYAQPDIDPEAAKAIMKKYDIDVNFTVMADDLFVVCGAKKKVLRLNDMMEWEYMGDNPYNQQRRPVAFKGEQFLTSAIVEVTEPKQTKIYALTGHGERNITDASPQGMMGLAGQLKRDNFNLETLPGIPDTGVPSDCDCLLVIAPAARLASPEVEKVQQYLARGGRLFLCEDVQQDSGLEDLMSQWGVNIGGDAVVSQDAQTFLGSPVAIIARDFGGHDITKPLQGFQIVFNFARSVTPAPGESSKFKVASLVETSSASFAQSDVDALFKSGVPAFDAEKDVKGPICLAVAVEEAGPAEGQGAPAGRKLARIVVFGDADVFSNDILKLPTKNFDLSRNALNWLVERKDLISISARPETEHIMVADTAAKRAVFWLLVIGMPLAILLLGGLVWALRSYGSRAA